MASAGESILQVFFSCTAIHRTGLRDIEVFERNGTGETEGTMKSSDCFVLTTHGDPPTC